MQPVQTNGARPPVDFSRLPASVAASLSKLSGKPIVPAPSEEPGPGSAGTDGKPRKG
jgi:hypothetical protein